MNCQEALELLYDYIDKEVNEIDEIQIRDHLKKCPDCFKKYSIEQKVNEFIEAKIRYDNPGPRLDALRYRILSRLNQLDCEHNSKKTKSFKISAIAITAVASLVILIGASLFTSDFVRHKSEYIPLEEAHVAFARQENSAYDQTEINRTLTAVREKLGYHINDRVDNFSLIGGSFEKILGVKMAHLLYSENGHKVSVFIAPIAEFTISDELENHKTVIDGINLYDHNCRGCRLVFHRNESAVIITATNDKEVELLKFIPGHSLL